MTFTLRNTFYEKLHLVQETSPASQQSFSTTYSDVDYSVIDYVPSRFSKYVEYSFIVHLSKDPSGSALNTVNLYFKLQYSEDDGSTWNDWGDNTEIFIGSDTSNIRTRGIAPVKFYLDIAASGSRGIWKGNRKLKLQGKVKNTSSDCMLNKLVEFRGDGGVVTGTWYYYPTVSCKSIKG